MNNYRPNYEEVAKRVGKVYLTLDETQLTLLVNACSNAWQDNEAFAKGADAIQRDTSFDHHSTPERVRARYAETAAHYKAVLDIIYKKSREWDDAFYAVERAMIRENRAQARHDAAKKAAVTRAIRKEVA